MSPSHPDRVRRNQPEVNCKHSFIYIQHSNIAPFIEKNGDRTTIEFCIDCGTRRSRTRTQEEFLNELNQI